MDRPCTSKLFPFWRGTLPPQEGAAQRPAASRPIQSAKTSHCHGSSMVPPTFNNWAASCPSELRYSGAILSDGSWLPSSLPDREDLADFVAIAFCSFYFLNFSDGLTVLLGQRRQCPCIFTAIYADRQHTRKRFELFQPVTTGGYTLHLHDLNHPFKNSLCVNRRWHSKGALGPMGRGILPPYHSPSLTVGAFVIFVPVFASKKFILLPFCALQK